LKFESRPCVEKKRHVVSRQTGSLRQRPRLLPAPRLGLPTVSEIFAMPSEMREWRGTLVKQRLFIGSKSEGEYWILLCKDGNWYRIATNLPSEQLQWLIDNQGLEVSLEASLDLFRGHRRLVLSEADKAAPPSEEPPEQEGLQ
jgi:hypothetical protein